MPLILWAYGEIQHMTPQPLESGYNHLLGLCTDIGVCVAMEQICAAAHICSIATQTPHTTSGMGLKRDVSGAVYVRIELGVRIAHRACRNTKASDTIADVAIEAGVEW